MLLKGLKLVIGLLLISVIHACGGGGGSGGGEAEGILPPPPEEIAPVPDVALPDANSASLKTLTPDTSKKSIMLAMQALDLIEASSIQAAPATDFYARPSSVSGKAVSVARKPQKLKTFRSTQQVSGVCYSGSLTIDGDTENTLGQKTLHYRRCDLGDVTYDGDLEINIRGAYDGVLTDVVYTFKQLRLIASDSDVGLEGAVAVVLNFPSGGKVSANLGVRDFLLRKGMRIADYRSVFSLDGADVANPGTYSIIRRSGRLIDDTGQYVELSTTPGTHDWPMLTGNHSSIVMGYSGAAYPYQVSMALDADGDNLPEHWLLADLAELSTEIAGNRAPRFLEEFDKTSLAKNETAVIRYGNVADPDQQFVTFTHTVTRQPVGSSPDIDLVSGGIGFASSDVGDYGLDIIASDGSNTATSAREIRVRYNPPELQATSPVELGFDESTQFSVDVLNPEEGDIRVKALALPGLQYDASSQVASFTPILPRLPGMHQVFASFLAENEDHQRIFSFPITVTAPDVMSAPMMISTVNSFDQIPQRWVGNFTADVSLEMAELFRNRIHLYEINGSERIYRESFIPYADDTPDTLQLIGAYDLNQDGVDEIVAVRNEYASRRGLLVFLDPEKRKVIREFRIGEEFDRSALCFFVADIDADSDVDFVVSGASRIYIFDIDDGLVWTSAAGTYGTSSVMTNLDGDPQLELFTASGAVLDLKAKIWHQMPNVVNYGSSLFLADMNGDNRDEIYTVDPAQFGVLRRIDGATPVTLFSQFYVQSRIVPSDVDNDGDQELVFIANYSAGHPQSPLLPNWNDAVRTLMYLDFDGTNYSLHAHTDISIGSESDVAYALYLNDFDGDGADQYLALGTDYFERTDESFTVDPASGQVAGFSKFSGIRLSDYLLGGDLYEAAGHFLFCGELFTSQDSLTYGSFTASDAGAGLGLVTPFDLAQVSGSWASCDLRILDNTGKEYLSVSYEPAAWLMPQLGGFVVKIIDPTSDAVVFQRVFETAAGKKIEFGDVDGDGDKEILVSDATQILAFDVFSGEQLALLNLESNESIVDVAAGNVTGDSASELLVQTGLRTLVYQYVAADGFAISAEMPAPFIESDFSEIFLLDADGDGKNEIALRGKYDLLSPYSQIRLYDGNLRAVSEWSSNPRFQSASLIDSAAGADLIATTEFDDETAGIKVVWHDPMTGTVVYVSPVLMAIRPDDVRYYFDTAQRVLSISMVQQDKALLVR